MATNKGGDEEAEKNPPSLEVKYFSLGFHKKTQKVEKLASYKRHKEGYRARPSSPVADGRGSGEEENPKKKKAHSEAKAPEEACRSALKDRQPCQSRKS